MSTLQKAFVAGQGTGDGHITRLRALVPALRNNNVDVTCFFSGRSADKYFNMEVFGEFSCAQGLTFHVEDGKLSYPKSAFYGAGLLPTYIRDVKKLAARLKEEKYDFIVDDYEPVASRAAQLAGIPSVGVHHQYAFLNKIPGTGENALFDFCMKHYAPVTRGIGIHWSPFDQPILPPMIEAFEAAAESDPQKIVVYMNFEAVDKLVAFFEHFPDYRFYIYSKENKEQKEIGNIILKKPSRTEFPKDLCSCAGVIMNAGFETPSELLRMGKKMLVKPLTGQPEQVFNAKALNDLMHDNVRYGTTLEKLDYDPVRRWLDQEVTVQVRWPDVAAGVAPWMAGGAQESQVQPLVDSMWAQIKPSLVPVPR